jgi:hypothetical protein
MPHHHVRFLATVAVAAALMPFSATARATIFDYFLLRSGAFTQSSPAAPTTADDYNFQNQTFVNAFSTDIDGGTLTYPGPGSPATSTFVSTPISPFPSLNYLSPNVPSQAVLDADFPAGIYTIAATNSATSTSQTTSFQVPTLDNYPHTVPALTPAGYTAAQGLNPAAKFLFNFTNFIPDASANQGTIDFAIDDASNNAVFVDGGLPSTTTGVTIVANLLQPGTSYTFSLSFEDAINSTGTNNINGSLFYIYTTSGSFSTAPEPTTLGLLSIAGLSLLLQRRR